jgi:hypothetical protein
MHTANSFFYFFITKIVKEVVADRTVNVEATHRSSHFLFCSYKNCDELGQRFILANVLPKDTLLTYGVRFNFTLSEFKSSRGNLRIN